MTDHKQSLNYQRPKRVILKEWNSARVEIRRSAYFLGLRDGLLGYDTYEASIDQQDLAGAYACGLSVGVGRLCANKEHMS